MAGFFKRKPRDWREDDYIFLEDLKKDPLKETPGPERKPAPVEPARPQHAGKGETVKERLDRLHQQRYASDVRDRLEHLQYASSAPKPLSERFFNDKVADKAQKKEMPENATLKKLDAAIKKWEMVRAKMDKTNSFLGLFYDLKHAETAFLETLKEAEEQVVDIPEHLQARINQIKSRLRLGR